MIQYDLDQYDVLIIGSGISGLLLALTLANKVLKIGILSKNSIDENSTVRAQGGVASVTLEEDSIESHIQDTFEASRHLSNKESIRFAVESASELIDYLIQLEVPFDRDSNGNLDLTIEGGHSFHRILHASDLTGKAIHETLVKKVNEIDNIDVLEFHMALEILLSENVLEGVEVLDIKQNILRKIPCRFLVLASGGASHMYFHTTNCKSSTGDGIALAFRAGCRVSNMEFIQFHPTCLYHSEGQSSFLISEALRGEGGKLRLPNGELFMHEFDDRLELAPRDIVSRAIDIQMRKYAIDHVYLDMTHLSEAYLKNRFPNIFKKCLEIGVNLSKHWIPIIPAAHYTCGGVMVNKYGQTDVSRLFAIGEVSCTGLHGANRLASNSLLECLVWSRSCGQRILQLYETLDQNTNFNFEESIGNTLTIRSDVQLVKQPNPFFLSLIDRVRRLMSNYVGIIRSDAQMQEALMSLKKIQTELKVYGRIDFCLDFFELKSLLLVASLTLNSALNRKESIGVHYSIDYPNRLPESISSVLSKENHLKSFVSDEFLFIDKLQK